MHTFVLRMYTCNDYGIFILCSSLCSAAYKILSCLRHNVFYFIAAITIIYCCCSDMVTNCSKGSSLLLDNT